MKQASDIDNYNSAFASIFRTLMDETGEKQYIIANKCNVTRQSVSQWINGNSKPDILSLGLIAEHFNVSTDFLLGLTPNRTTDKDLNAVCEFTGLSQKAVENISGKNSELLSDIFESNEFQQILKVFADAKRNCALLKSSGDLTAAAVIARAGLTLKVNQDETISLDHIPPIFSQALLAIGENGLAPVYKHQISELISSLFDNLNGGENNG